MTIPTADEIAKNAEAVRDLKLQVNGLTTEALPDIEFRHFTPGRTPVTIYAVEDGRPITIPEYQLITVIDKRLEDGRFMFVSDPKDAPEYKMGTILCFMHKDSPDRATLDAAGLGGKFCRKHTLPSDYAKVIHAEHRHGREWAAFSRHVASQKEAVREARLDSQLEATLSIARAQGSQAVEAQGAAADGRAVEAAAAPQAVDPDCPRCGWEQGASTKNRRAALVAHARAKHPVAEVV